MFCMKKLYIDFWRAEYAYAVKKNNLVMLMDKYRKIERFIMIIINTEILYGKKC